MATTFAYLFFDLDGTLTNPAEGITKSVAHALRHYGVPVPPLEELRPFIGPPLADSFQKYFFFPQPQAQEAIQVYREYFRDKGIFENQVYEGIQDLLHALVASGKKLAVTSSKPQPFVLRILEHFQIRDCFSLVCGASMDEKLCRKNDIIRKARTLLPLATSSNAIVIGDHPLDVSGAHENGLPACAVLYGFGAPEEIAAASPEYLAHSVAELWDILL